jgi:cytochrome c oxidase assembly protein subunit 15
MKSERPITIWLLVVAVMVFCMVVLGGATRLTHSGLSMVEWRPLMGILPPWGDAAWQDVFDKYRQYPEYQKINKGMSLPEFKQIFYFEYSHRVLGRLIGAAFAVPFLFFLFTKRVAKQRLASLIGLFLLGGFQGLIGWWMVKSGLVDNPDVSHYRLTVHMGVAILIFGALIWVALNILRDASGRIVTGGTGPVGLALVVVVIVFLQMLLGAMVAGLDAGFLYNTFPDMNGNWLAEDIWHMTPGWINLMENPATVQFSHRIGAYLTAILVLLLWWRGLKTGAVEARAMLHATLILLVVQFLIGVLTLILVVPLSLGIAHQAVALLLFASCVYTAHKLRSS